MDKVMYHSHFSILINGVPFGIFRSCRGLKQGDPISPLLFVMMIEVLHKFLQQFQRRHMGLSTRHGGVVVTNLHYVDDILLFGWADLV